MSELGKRELLARTLEATRLFRITALLSSSRLTVFNYHRIAGGDPVLEPFDSSTYGPTADGLREELRQMKRHADPVSQDDLIAAVHGRGKLPKRSFLVTFDDGYRDNYDRALPVLKEERIPAIYFIPTHAIEERELGWWDLIAWAVKRTRRSEITVRGQAFSLQDRGVAIARLHTMIKLGQASENAALLDELNRTCEVDEPARELRDAQLMTWEQIRECVRQGITIGSHTHSHRVLASIDLASQREELMRSKRILEERLGKEVRSLAYPVGGYEHFNRETKDLAREAGYELAFSYHTGVNRASALDPFDIRRMMTETPALFAGVFCLPRVFGRAICDLREPASRVS